MPGSSPSPSDDFDLIYILHRHGWSDLHVLSGSTKLEIGISHVFSNPIVDLIGLCKALLLGQQSCSVTLRDEPGETVIEASVYPSQRHVIRVEIWWPAQGKKPPDDKLLLQIDIKTKQFVGLIYRQIEKIRWLCEEKSYRANRNGFPHREFEELDALLQR
jgi:hypothetical protein